jgi:hypothetical protein
MRNDPFSFDGDRLTILRSHPPVARTISRSGQVLSESEVVSYSDVETHLDPIYGRGLRILARSGADDLVLLDFTRP